MCAIPDEKIVPVGSMEVRVIAPRISEESSSRISFWWGLTSASIALSRHVHSLGGNVSGKRVIELGCGLGLAGITAGLSGADVLFTDYVPSALDFSRKNAILNGLSDSHTRFHILDWEDSGELGTFDMILGSEILYDYFFHGSLVSIIRRCLAPDGVVLLADRKRLCVSRFMGRLASAGFSCWETVSTVTLSGFPCQEITVFSLSRLQ
ncbi:MAG TPA: methyltransferase domain-containing protein [Desulfomonilaceae bacterium]|nr:methyltransferase domain-containing protein [Desulfomonilaceae bacterium]